MAQRSMTNCSDCSVLNTDGRFSRLVGCDSGPEIVTEAD
jgi:hypothetical protein